MRHPVVRLAVVLATWMALLSTAPSAAPQASTAITAARTTYAQVYNMGTLSVHFRWSGNRFLSRLHTVEAFRAKYMARMTEFSERLFVPERFMQQISELGPVLRPSIQLEGTKLLAAFDQVAAGRAGIVPNVTSRSAFVEAELEKGAR